MRTTGHTCEEAEDGQIAVEKVKEKMATTKQDEQQPLYDVVLMDFVMPVMDGPDSTKAIRALGVTCPIFGVTGNTLDTDIQVVQYNLSIN